jgi:hypothetical protein
LKAKVGPIVHRYSQEHDRSVDHESPFDAPSRATDGIEQRPQTSEEQHYDEPLNGRSEREVEHSCVGRHTVEY